MGTGKKVTGTVRSNKKEKKRKKERIASNMTGRKDLQRMENKL